ncbi:virulence-associated E family protein [Sporanaerobacter sp. PP17-6a]|uniref:virulence-associated E family protein n=1 Tax=Sporanaerobacter sp. PP17-6a TaxID=1891289 RepID=UPI001F3EF808|nr:virulence-associated E family protein [Sporanaerobacter sp. PP17-6a]
MSKAKQDNLKDVGGFVAGSLKDNKRGSNNIKGRDIVVLDLDNIPAEHTQDVLLRLEGLGCGYAVYSTRKHEPLKPRLRVLLPLNRTCTADEYEPIARKIASIVGIELCDPTTFQASRLMYWPSCCSNSQYVYQFADKPFIDADGMLGMYSDWRNVAEWPQVPGAQQTQTRRAEKQTDPTGKEGIIGAFCRVYDIYKAINTFIPNVYAACDMENRLTYTGGSTTAGAIIYDNGKFLYSHHATDPAGGKLCNAFDLVRLHRFGELDEESKPDTPISKLPSYKAMCEFAVKDKQVSSLLNQERYNEANIKFSTEIKDDANWIGLLKVSPSSGKSLKTIENVRIVLEHDPLLKGRIKEDKFGEFICLTAPLPWGNRQNEKGTDRWKDADSSGLREYIEKILGFRSGDIVDDALRNHASANGFNPVTDYLNNLEWDEVLRLDTLFIDYLGAEDSKYLRTVTRKALTAAVARAMQPGIKFDYMPVICGRQGIGKSTILRKLGKNWFSDSIKTFEGKDGAELLQGVWIVEISELEAFNKSDINAVKSFLSKEDDQYRAAYGRITEKHLRKSVFFGTTNNYDYLRDPTGNRRFWPVDAEIQEPTKSIFQDLDEELDQIWAEAVMRWRLGEPLYLSKEMEEEAEKKRQEHIDRDPLQGQIEEFLDQPLPCDWQKWSLDRRRMFWANGVTGDIKLVKRDKICAAEIWKECLCESKNIPKKEARRINSILDSLPGWKRADVIRFGAEYGRQKGFKRIEGSLNTLKIVDQNVHQPEKNVHQISENVR